MDILLEYSVYSTFPINSDISGILKSHSKTTFHIVTAFLTLPAHDGLVCGHSMPDHGAGHAAGHCPPALLGKTPRGNARG